MENGNFANYMREHGQKRKLVSAEHQREEEIYPETGQIFVTREQMSTWINNVGLLHSQDSHKTDTCRYTTAPVAENFLEIITMQCELFHAQSSRWGDITRDHVTTITDLVLRFVQSVLTFVNKRGEMIPHAAPSIRM